MKQTTLSDLNLLDLDSYLKGAPQEWFKQLRKGAPVHWHQEPDGPGFWVLSRHADVVAATKNWQAFSSDLGNGGIMGMTEVERSVIVAAQFEKNVAMMDPPEHSKYRSVVVAGMMPSLVKSMEPTLRTIAGRLIDSAVQKGRCDFVGDVSAWMTLEGLAELANIPIEDRQQVFDWVNMMGSPDDPEYNPRGASGYLESRAAFQSYCRDLYAIRKGSPGNDVLSFMIQGEIDGKPVTSEHASSFLELLIAAGSETTRNTLTHGVLALIEHPMAYKTLRASPELLKSTATEEILRWATPLLYFRRGVVRPVELSGHRLEPGQSVVMLYMSANRDETVFAEPFTFNLQRQPNPHVTFGGGGPHACLGAMFARLQVRVFFEEWLRKVDEVRVVGNAEWIRSNLIHGIKHLPIEFSST
jgi:cholest-4-en-3-one 26-monooxygenase